MIYFDNAATGGFKPFKSIDSAVSAMKNLNVNAGRSAHKLSAMADEIVYETRQTVAKFVGASKAENVIFTHNCTDALNVAIFGLYQKGCHVITTVTEHNATLRPLYELERRGEISLTIITPKSGKVKAEDVERELTNNTKLVVLNAVSNVNGEENDVFNVGKLLSKTDAKFIVDGAQAVGHIDLNVNNQLIDALCLAGHKGLMAIQGIGVLVLNDGVNVQPSRFGGTGTDSFSREMPDCYPERLEAGTLNLPAICSLKSGVEYLSANSTYLATQTLSLTEYLISKLKRLPYIKLYSKPNKSGIVCFNHRDFSSQEICEILSEKYSIAVRGGYHCAPLMHKFLKTDKLGAVRVSFSLQNTRKEINALISALEEISAFI
ncbi:MAG: aminotransferase class V-fold PLP-dependent enzyme [Clostridia bacterium]|nr:aminotransferase class V-fold PLP-dependent enzyme [Clostridia bacterium]